MLKLRERIAVTAIAASGLALLALLLLVSPELRRWAMEETRTRLLAEARLAAHVTAEPLAAGAGPEVLDPLLDAVARDVEARLTLVAPDGTVLADSAVSGEALRRLENHRDRPEVRAALATGVGTAIRPSATVSQDLFYGAIAMRQGSRVVGVMRVALSLEGVERHLWTLRRAVLLALLLAFLITAGLSVLLSAPIAGPLQEVMASAHRFAAGDFSARMPVRRRDEVGELAAILNQAAERLEERLEEIGRGNARTEAILSAMEDGVLAVDHRGTVVLASKRLRERLELGEAVGRHYLEVLRHRELGGILEEVLRTGEPRVREVALRRPARAYAVTVAPFPAAPDTRRAGGTEPLGAVVTFHDVTERRRLDRIRRDFVANASHELRTPLTSIRGFVEALEDGALSEPELSTRFLGKIRTHADRMATLVEDLLELSRLESGEQPPAFEPAELGTVVEEVAAALGEAAVRKRITLTTHLGAAPSVATDADRVRRILDNLVDNAVKYTPEEGHVTVTLEAEGPGGVRVEVRDDGPGIAAEHLPRIFERFYRVDKARSRDVGGTGLGLSIVRHLAESIGAAVEVASTPGQGSCFTLHLPGQPPAAEGTPRAS